MHEDMPTSEVLGNEEIAAITGYTRPSKQRSWLDENGWKYIRNRADHPIVGRIYARMKLAGISPGKTAPQELWSLDLTTVS